MTPRLAIPNVCASVARRTGLVHPPPPRRIAAASRTFTNDTTSNTPDHDDFATRFLTSMPGPGKKPSDVEPDPNTLKNDEALKQLQEVAYGLNPYDPKIEGHKFGLPELPIPKGAHLKYRYDSVLVQLTKLLMRDGKLSKAQRDMAMVLNYLRTSPAPKTNPERPLLPGSPPAAHLPLNPVLYLTLAIDSVAPLIRMRHFKGLAGGGRSLDVPVPLIARQRRRTAFQWILDAVNKKSPKGSGRAMLPNRIAEEIVAIVEGKSPVWDRRQQLHKLGTAARANLGHTLLRKKK